MEVSLDWRPRRAPVGQDERVLAQEIASAAVIAGCNPVFRHQHGETRLPRLAQHRVEPLGTDLPSHVGQALRVRIAVEEFADCPGHAPETDVDPAVIVDSHEILGGR